MYLCSAIKQKQKNRDSMSIKDFFKKFASTRLWAHLLGMLLVVVLLFFGVQWWLSIYTHHGEGVDVPQLYNMDYDEAEEMLEELGLLLSVNDSAYMEGMAAGRILQQSPREGASVKEGRTIYVKVSSQTMPTVEIPDLINNSSYRRAKARLQSLAFILEEPKLIDGEKDWVYGIECDGRSVHTGERVAKRSRLTLVIGNGTSEEENLDDYDGGSLDFPLLPNDDIEEEDDLPLITDEDGD